VVLVIMPYRQGRGHDRMTADARIAEV